MPREEDDLSAEQQLNERINQLMFRSKVTQRKLAQRLGRSQPAVSRKLHSQRSWTISELITLSAALGVSLEDILQPFLGKD